ncbi:recombinase family protein [Nocardioides ultimimeridianus]
MSKRVPTVIIYLRLSRDSDSSTSIAAQRRRCMAYAKARGWRVLFVSDEDVDVSGAKRLEDRPGMARVLAALPSADYVLAWKLDRYARSVLEFSRLMHAAEEARTSLVTEDGTLSPETSKLVVQVLSAFAEYERDMIKARIAGNKEHLREVGSWLGGAAPYGYKIVRRGRGAYLDLDPESAAVARECADRLIHHGATLAGLARELDERGILPPADHARKRDGRPVRGTKWSPTTLRDVLISPVARGYLVKADPNKPRTALHLVPVLDADGTPHRVGPELLDSATWAAVRDVIESRSVGRGSSRAGRAMLLHVASCALCDGPMYRQTRAVNGVDYSTYVCPNGIGKHGSHESNIVQSAGLEAQVEDAFLRAFGRTVLMSPAITEGRDVGREIRETEEALDNLAGNLAALPPGGRSAQTVTGQITALEARLENLQREAEVPTRREWISDGTTVAEEWRSRDTIGRNTLLRDFGTRVAVTPLPRSAERRFTRDRSEVTFDGPAWFREDPALAELEAIARVEDGTSSGPSVSDVRETI